MAAFLRTWLYIQYNWISTGRSICICNHENQNLKRGHYPLTSLKGKEKTGQDIVGFEPTYSCLWGIHSTSVPTFSCVKIVIEVASRLKGSCANSFCLRKRVEDYFRPCESLVSHISVKTSQGQQIAAFCWLSRNLVAAAFCWLLTKTFCPFTKHKNWVTGKKIRLSLNFWQLSVTLDGSWCPPVWDVLKTNFSFLMLRKTLSATLINKTKVKTHWWVLN